MPFIAKHPVRQILRAVQHQIQPLGFGAGLHHGDRTADRFAQVERFAGDLDPPGFNA